MLETAFTVSLPDQGKLVLLLLLGWVNDIQMTYITVEFLDYVLGDIKVVFELPIEMNWVRGMLYLL